MTQFPGETSRPRWASSSVEDDRSLVELCRAEWPRLVGSLSLDVGSRGLAEDLAQETLVAFNPARSHGRRQSTWARVRTRALDGPLGTVDPDRASPPA